MTQTKFAIDAGRFTRNGVPTHAGRMFRGADISGLLFNVRMANAIVDDRNPATSGVWAYNDGPWNALRNTREFCAALPVYRAHGLDAVAVNMQGGSPQGYSWNQPWDFSAYTPDGTPHADILVRLDMVLAAADAAGLAVNLGLFYGMAARRLTDEAAVLRAVDAVIAHVVAGGWQHVLIEIGNEIDNIAFTHDIIKPARCLELIARVRGRLPVSTSFNGGVVPPDAFIAGSDYVLLHGNNVEHPDGIRAMVAAVRASPAYRGQPIVFNEDDHYDFAAPDNNMLAAIGAGASWGFFDYRRIRERFADGYQSLPVDWGITSERKRGYFGLLANITGRT